MAEAVIGTTIILIGMAGAYTFWAMWAIKLEAKFNRLDAKIDYLTKAFEFTIFGGGHDATELKRVMKS